MKAVHRSSAHTKHRMLIHLVWIPKYRKRILKGAIAVRIEELLRECADVNRWEIHELNIQPDHIHMLLQYHPNVTVSEIANKFKGRSSRIIRKEFPSIQEFLWGDSFWADGYYVDTVGVNEEKIRDYIKNQ